MLICVNERQRDILLHVLQEQYKLLLFDAVDLKIVNDNEYEELAREVHELRDTIETQALGQFGTWSMTPKIAS